ncbi:MAG TPA: adenylate/guanylate cyclase domain-containing protein [Frankiaceae bacterium]|nr:adenylate/guanylate cyclase domain-containing protein [Frankiaceae bacterium]
MHETPRTRYARTRDSVHLAYQVFGEGPAEILHCGVHWWQLEFQWTDPDYRSFLERLGRLGRVILFDKRGTGLSDRVAVDELPSIEARVDDLVTVLDEVGVERAVLYGSNYGAQLAMVFAATFPDRVEALVVQDGMARLVRDEDYPWGITADLGCRTLERMERRWDEPVNLQLVAPTRQHDPTAIEWWATMQRLAASPAAAVGLMKIALDTDIRAVLPTVRCPTLVVVRRDNRLIEAGHGRHLAARIAGARLVELPGADIFFTPMDDLADVVEEFVTGRPPPVRSDRVLAAVMFTDLVDSTATAAREGDRAWREILDRHDALVDRTIERYRGRKIKTTGDGVLATFDGPARAVQCASAICEGVTALGLRARAGVHVGEVELRGADIGGVAVHVGARIAAAAGPGEVLVSRTVTDLVAGSGLDFEDRGEHVLRGIDAAQHLFAMVR